MAQSRLDTYENYQAEAAEVEAGYLRALEALRLREDLSPKGKADAAAKLDAERRNKVERLQGLHAMSLRLDREHYADELRKAQTAEVARLRRVLGDATLTHIYERRLERMTAAQILDMHAAAVDEWQKTLLGELGAAIIEGRSSQATQDTDRQAVAWLRQTPQAVRDAEEALDELRRAETAVDRLDVHTYAQQMAVTYGVQAQHVAAAMSGVDVQAGAQPLDTTPAVRHANMFGVVEEA